MRVGRPAAVSSAGKPLGSRWTRESVSDPRRGMIFPRFYSTPRSFSIVNTRAVKNLVEESTRRKVFFFFRKPFERPAGITAVGRGSFSARVVLVSSTITSLTSDTVLLTISLRTCNRAFEFEACVIPCRRRARNASVRLFMRVERSEINLSVKSQMERGIFRYRHRNLMFTSNKTKNESI